MKIGYHGSIAGWFQDTKPWSPPPLHEIQSSQLGRPTLARRATRRHGRNCITGIWSPTRRHTCVAAPFRSISQFHRHVRRAGDLIAERQELRRANLQGLVLNAISVNRAEGRRDPLAAQCGTRQEGSWDCTVDMGYFIAFSSATEYSRSSARTCIMRITRPTGPGVFTPGRRRSSCASASRE